MKFALGASKFRIALLGAVLAASPTGCKLALNRSMLESAANVTTALPGTPAPSVGYASSEDIVLTFTNQGGGTAESMTFSGLAAPFTHAGGTCGTELAAGASCTYIVRFTSPGVGSYAATVTLEYSDSAGPATVTQAVSATGTLISLSVQPYFSNAPNWNDYVKNDHASNDPLLAGNVACVGTETGGYFQACVHGGEYRKTVVTGVSSCAGLTAQDQLGAFTWVCRDGAGYGNTATFISKRLKSDKGLQHLLASSGLDFEDNRVSVYSGATLIAQSPLENTWWTNTIEALPNNSGGGDSVVALNGSGKIYTLAASRATQGYNIDADKIAVVILPGAVLSYGGSATNNYSSGTGEIAGADERAVLASGTAKFLWIEGDVDGEGGTNDAHASVYFRYARFYVARLMEIRGGSSSQANFSSSHNGHLSHIRTDNYRAPDPSSNDGLVVYASDGVWTNDIMGGRRGAAFFFASGDNHRIRRIKGNGNVSVYTSNSLVSDVMIYNSDMGFSFYNNSNNTAVNIAVIGGGSYPLRFPYGANRMTVKNVTLLNTSNVGIYFQDNGNYNTVVNAVVANNQNRAVSFYSSQNNILSQIAMAHLTGAASGVLMDTTSDNIFRDNLILEAGAACSIINGGSNQGLDGSCNPNGISTATRHTGMSFASSFVGKIASDDATNLADSSGASSFANVTATSWLDLLRFDQFLRGWARAGSAPFPDSSHLGDTGSAALHIWDLRLSSSDTVLRDTTVAVTSANAPFVNGAACPAHLHGNVVITDQQTSPNTFLIHATELIEDDIGDDDGLCESNEACVYAPNFGVYQGEGDYTTRTCTFQNGTVTGVTMYAYPTNGG